MRESKNPDRKDKQRDAVSKSGGFIIFLVLDFFEVKITLSSALF